MKKLSCLIFVLICTLICASLAFTSAADSRSMTLHAVYIGDTVGDCVIIESDGEYLVQDIGSDVSYPYIKAYLEKLGAEKISVYLSHLHPDHTGSLSSGGGFEQILKDFEIEKIYIPDEEIYTSNGLFAENMEASYHYLDNRISQSRYDSSILVPLKTGSTFSFGSVSAEVLGPVHPENYKLSDFKDRSSSGGDDKQHSYENNSSLVTMFTCSETKYLTLGDAGDFQSSLLVGEYGNKLDADIFELSHHGRPEGVCDETVLSYVTPTYSFAQNCGEHCALKTDSHGIKHVITEGSRKNAKKYGIVATTGEQKTNIIIDASNDTVSLYTGEKKAANKLTGVFSLKGGDGVHYTEDTYYVDNSSKPVTGVVKLDGKTYLFENGCRIQGEYIHDTKDKTQEMFWPFVSYGDRRRAFTMDGEMLTGFRKPFEKNTDRYSASSSDIYYFDEKGFTIAGDPAYSTLYNIGGKYYLISDTGKVFTGSTRVFTLPDGTQNSRYFTSDGAMRTGWYEKDGKKYYLQTSGKNIGFRTIGYQKIGSAYYYFYSAGNMASEKWVEMTVNGKKGSRYFGKDGKMLTGFQTIGGKKYYLQTSGAEIGFRKTGFQKIGSDYYNFTDSGVMSQNKWLEMTAGGKKGSRYFGKDGKMLTGWQTIGGYKYYLTTSGTQVGFRKTGFQKIGSDYYSFTDAGKLNTSKTVKIGDFKYSFDKNGKMTTKVPAAKIKSVKYSKSVTTVTIENRTDVTGYILYRSTSKSGTYKKIATLKASSYTYKDKKAPSGKKCYYMVKSYRTAGSYTLTSAASAKVKAK